MSRSGGHSHSSYSSHSHSSYSSHSHSSHSHSSYSSHSHTFHSSSHNNHTRSNYRNNVNNNHTVGRGYHRGHTMRGGEYHRSTNMRGSDYHRNKNIRGSGSKSHHKTNKDQGNHTFHINHNNYDDHVGTRTQNNNYHGTVQEKKGRKCLIF